MIISKNLCTSVSFSCISGNVLVPAILTNDEKGSNYHWTITVETLIPCSALFSFQSSRYIFAWIREYCVLADSASGKAILFSKADEDDYEDLSDSIADALDLDIDIAFVLLQVSLYLKNLAGLVLSDGFQ